MVQLELYSVAWRKNPPFPISLSCLSLGQPFSRLSMCHFHFLGDCDMSMYDRLSHRPSTIHPRAGSRSSGTAIFVCERLHWPRPVLSRENVLNSWLLMIDRIAIKHYLHQWLSADPRLPICRVDTHTHTHSSCASNVLAPVGGISQGPSFSVYFGFLPSFISPYSANSEALSC